MSTKLGQVLTPDAQISSFVCRERPKVADISHSRRYQTQVLTRRPNLGYRGMSPPGISASGNLPNKLAGPARGPEIARKLS